MMRIAYCINSYGSGGVEQITVIKANALAELEGNNVWIIHTDPPMEGGFHKPSQKVKLIDLHIGYRDNQHKFPWNIFILIRQLFRHKKALSKALKEIKPDVVISTGQKEQWIVPHIKGNWIRIRELHMTKGSRLKCAKTKRDHIVSKISEYLEFEGILNRYDTLVVQTIYEKEADWHNDNRVAVIPNPVRLTDTVVSSLDNKKILAIGRLESGKNYSSLIRAFRIVSDRFPDWTLTILGKGTEESLLKKLADSLELSHKVYLPGFVPDTEKFLADASIFVHTSMYEALGMVLIEAMSCGLPVVAYDCPFGPRSIISNGIDGYLVTSGDELLLADRICTLIDNAELRKRMGSAAFDKSKDYRIEVIVAKWMNLFLRLTNHI